MPKSFFFWFFLIFLFSLSFFKEPFLKVSNFDFKKNPPKTIEIKRENLKKIEKFFSVYLTPYFSFQFLKNETSKNFYFGNYLLAKLTPVEGKVDESQQLIRYKVKKGDTLFKIAKKFGVSYSSIIFANGKKKSSYIYPGEELFISLRTGFLHQVKENETLKEIAKKYHLPLKILKEANKIDEVEVGQIILIPQKNFFEKLNSQKKDSFYNLFSYFQIPASGWRKKDFLKNSNEIYISNSCGTPIYAAASGIVVFAKKGFNNGLGNYIEIQHPNGKKTLYAHLDKILVKSGEFVFKGQKIATMGKTGKIKSSRKSCLLYFQVK